MKKLLFVIITIIVAVVVVVMWPETSSAPTKTEVTQPSAATPSKMPADVTLSMGQEGRIDDLLLTWKEPIEDSRCPTGAQCIWAGEARAKVSLTSGKKTETISMILGRGEAVFGKYKISIVAVTPHPEASGKISQDKYLVTFHVSSAQS